MHKRISPGRYFLRSNHRHAFQPCSRSAVGYLPLTLPPQEHFCITPTDSYTPWSCSFHPNTKIAPAPSLCLCDHSRAPSLLFAGPPVTPRQGATAGCYRLGEHVDSVTLSLHQLPLTQRYTDASFVLLQNKYHRVSGSAARRCDTAVTVPQHKCHRLARQPSQHGNVLSVYHRKVTLLSLELASANSFCLSSPLSGSPGDRNYLYQPIFVSVIKKKKKRKTPQPALQAQVQFAAVSLISQSSECIFPHNCSFSPQGKYFTNQIMGKVLGAMFSPLGKYTFSILEAYCRYCQCKDFPLKFCPWLVTSAGALKGTILPSAESKVALSSEH